MAAVVQPCPQLHRRVVISAVSRSDRTVVLDFMRECYGALVAVLPDAADIVSRRGLLWGQTREARKAAQQAIFFTERELEAAAPTDRRLILCPLGTVDAAAGWPGPEDFWASVGTTYRAELAAYSAVIHLRRTAGADPWTEARLDQLWAPHARRFVFDLSADIIEKAPKMLAILREEAAAALSPDGSGAIAPVTASGTLDDDLAVPDAAELWGIPAEESRRRPDERHSPAA